MRIGSSRVGISHHPNRATPQATARRAGFADRMYARLHRLGRHLGEIAQQQRPKWIGDNHRSVSLMISPPNFHSAAPRA